MKRIEDKGFIMFMTSRKFLKVEHYLFVIPRTTDGIRKFVESITRGHVTHNKMRFHHKTWKSDKKYKFVYIQ